MAHRRRSFKTCSSKAARASPETTVHAHRCGAGGVRPIFTSRSVSRTARSSRTYIYMYAATVTAPLRGRDTVQRGRKVDHLSLGCRRRPKLQMSPNNGIWQFYMGSQIKHMEPLRSLITQSSRRRHDRTGNGLVRSKTDVQ